MSRAISRTIGKALHLKHDVLCAVVVAWLGFVSVDHGKEIGPECGQPLRIEPQSQFVSTPVEF
jgi:hypothetical protein